jgi:hypothetical protein
MPAMRALPVVVPLLLVLGVGAWLLSLGDDAPPPPSQDTVVPGSPEARQPSPATARTEATPAPGPVTAPAAAATAPAATAADAGAAADAVTLHVRTVGSHAPIPQFQWLLRGEVTGRGTGSEGRVELDLAPGTRGELVVEAPGHTPHHDAAFVAPAAGAARVVDVFLTPAALATGIVLQVRRSDQTPVARVRVDAFRLQGDARDTVWQITPALWSRATEAADGRYELPVLEPGEYGIRLVALEPGGELAPLLPFQRVFVLTGNNGFTEDVVLEPGCVPVLEVCDRHGAVLAPEPQQVVGLDLRAPGGPPSARRWLGKGERGPVAAIDRRPAPSATWPAEAVPAGVWQLDVFVDGELRLQQQLVLRAGERQHERVFAP